MPTTPSPYDDPNPYHPWIRGYDYHDPLENKEDAQDPERLEGVRLEKEQLYVVEYVDKHFIGVGFAPIRQSNTHPCMENPPFGAYYAAEAMRQILAKKEEHAANINLVEGHKRNQFYSY
jgi:hypothetical protein